MASSERDLHDGLGAAMTLYEIGQQFLAQIDLRFSIVDGVSFVFDYLEAEMVERPAHIVKAVLRLDDDLIKALLDGPDLLLLRQRAEVSLTAPVAPRAADPRIEHPPPVKAHVISQAIHKIRQLGFAFRRGNLVRDFKRHRDHRAWIVR